MNKIVNKRPDSVCPRPGTPIKTTCKQSEVTSSVPEQYVCGFTESQNTYNQLTVEESHTVQANYTINPDNENKEEYPTLIDLRSIRAQNLQPLCNISVDQVAEQSVSVQNTLVHVTRPEISAPVNQTSDQSV